MNPTVYIFIHVIVPHKSVRTERPRFKKFSPARRPSAPRKAKKFSRLLRIPAFLMVGPSCIPRLVTPKL